MTDILPAVTGESRHTIPLKELYHLEKNQEFFGQKGVYPSENYPIPPAKQTWRPLKGSPPYATQRAEAQKLTLEESGYFEKVEFVKELNVVTGEPTGGYGFIVTKKPQEVVAQ